MGRRPARQGFKGSTSAPAHAPQVLARLDQLAPAAPADGAAAAASPADDDEQMETDALLGGAGAGAGEAAASPFATRLARFKVSACLHLQGWGAAGGCCVRCGACLRPPLAPPASTNRCPAHLPPPPACPQTVLSGEVPIELERQFLARHNHADLQVRLLAGCWCWCCLLAGGRWQAGRRTHTHAPPCPAPPLPACRRS